MFDHILYTATRGCFLLLGKFDLEIINYSETAVEVFGRTDMTQMKFLDLVHESDRETVRNLVSSTMFPFSLTVYSFVRRLTLTKTCSI